MPGFVFRCQFCDAVPEPETQRSLELNVRELVTGEYRNALPARWLIWTGNGLFGQTRYACPQHRGELTAYLRHHYGSLGPHAWKMPPYLEAGATPASARTHRLNNAGAPKF